MKTIVITGSTDGIGKLAAKKLAMAGHHVVLHGRNQQKLEQTISELKSTTNNNKLSGIISDLSDVGSIRSMAVKISQKHPSIDVLINNAGVYHSALPQNPKGMDMRFAVNYLAPYILTHALVPVLQKGNSPRVINLSSAAQQSVSMEAFLGQEPISPQSAYAQSKLALTMWSFYFAQENPDITTIAVNPGSLLNTKMVKEAFGQHWSPADKGARILFDLAILEKYAPSNGKYFDNDRGAFNKAHLDAYDKAKIKQLISATEKMIQD